MAFKTFSLLVVIRTCLIMLTLLVLTSLLSIPGYHVATAVTCILLLALCFELVKFVSKTNNELVRFLEAAQFSDFSQRFDLSQQGAGFEELGKTFSQILNKLHAKRSDSESRIRYLTSLVEHVPVPLVSVSAEGSVTLWNFSARKLFAQHTISHVDDFCRYGPEVAEAIAHTTPGERKLIRLSIDGMEHKLSLSVSHLRGQGRKDSLISMQDIQSELDFAQMAAWQDLVNVLTHEIMNSITPVSSLAKTSVELVNDIRANHLTTAQSQQEMSELHHAIDTVARRSDSLINFVSSYRKLTDMPTVHWGKVEIQGLFNLVMTIAKEADPNSQVQLTQQIVPSNLHLEADKGLLEQVLINLLKNAMQATDSMGQNGKVQLCARINRRGRGEISVSDNGPGIDEEVMEQIFVPFFTTKREGSGVGLALTRQIMIAHGGSVKAQNQQQGGAILTLFF